MLVAATSSARKQPKRRTSATPHPLDKVAPLIPRHVLFGNPDKAMARMSHDGKRLAYLAPVDDVLNVWVGPIDDPSAAKAGDARKRSPHRKVTSGPTLTSTFSTRKTTRATKTSTFTQSISKPAKPRTLRRWKLIRQTKLRRPTDRRGKEKSAGRNRRRQLEISGSKS